VKLELNRNCPKISIWIGQESEGETRGWCKLTVKERESGRDEWGVNFTKNTDFLGCLFRDNEGWANDYKFKLHSSNYFGWLKPR